MAAEQKKDASQALAAAPERREHPRFGIKLRIQVAVGRTILAGRSEDLSKGGASLRLEEDLPVGLPIAVRFLTPYLEAFQYIDVTATVQHTSLTSDIPPWRIGVKFTGANSEAKRRIAMLIGE